MFSRHNMASDPPFSRLDLISCRNVLIYMDAALQRRVIPLLHYALNPNGFLFLGSSENIGGFRRAVRDVDSRQPDLLPDRQAAGSMPRRLRRLARRWRDTARRARTSGAACGTPWTSRTRPIGSSCPGIAPVGVVVDETMTVFQFRGRTAAYLEPAPGMASLDLFRMLREGLLAEVRSATAQAKAENVGRHPRRLAVRRGRHRAAGPDRSHPVQGAAFRDPVLPGPVPGAPRRPSVPPPGPPRPGRPHTDEQVVQLQQEIGALREYLQSVIEEQESTNEELKSANEEILSANEELQSTNEELQTAKEEAQSANEELATVNEELRHRNAELARVNNDLVNLLSGVNIPIVMVSRDLRIRRFTPLAEKVFNLIPSDIGRPISDIKPNLEVDGPGRDDQRGDRLPDAARGRGQGHRGAVVLAADPPLHHPG